MSLSEQEIIRREKLQKLTELGIDAFPAAEYKITDKGADINIQVHNLYKDSKLIQLPSGYGLHLSDIEVSKDGSPFHTFSLNQSENDLSISLPKGTFEIKGKIFWVKFLN